MKTKQENDLLNWYIIDSEKTKPFENWEVFLLRKNNATEDKNEATKSYYAFCIKKKPVLWSKKAKILTVEKITEIPNWLSKGKDISIGADIIFQSEKKWVSNIYKIIYDLVEEYEKVEKQKSPRREYIKICKT